MTSLDLCQSIITEHLSQLSDNCEIAPSYNVCYLLTPFIRPDGEGIELELTRLLNGNFRLSDMGGTLGYLYVNGLNLAKTLLDKARQIAKEYGVSFDGNAIVWDDAPNSVVVGIHNLIQAVLAITGLIYTKRYTARSLFNDEVEAFIISIGVSYDFDFRIRGDREYHKFKFHINSGRNLLLQPLSATAESAAHPLAERWAYRFMDTVNYNGIWNPVAILDDRKARQGVWTPQAQAPIADWAILWAEKERLAAMLIG